MNCRKLSILLLFSLVLILTSCTSFRITPEVDEIKHEPTTINTFSYQVDAHYKKHFFELGALDITESILANSDKIAVLPVGEGGTHLSINLMQRLHGGACGQDYLTGLSLGLIPSWCTRPGMYTFNFKLHQNDKVCSSKEYVIDEIGYGHIILLPFGIFELINGVYSGVLDLYEEALSSFVQAGCK